MIPPTPFSSYRQLLTAIIAKPVEFVARTESSDRVQVERGIILRNRLAGNVDGTSIARLIELANHGRHGNIAVVDAMGHTRPVYRPLMIYCWLIAYEISLEDSWISPLQRWCETLMPVLRYSEEPNLPGAHGSAITETVWSALAIGVAGELFGNRDWIIAGKNSFDRLCIGQQPSGAFLHALPSDNPETIWYHELILLQAVASYATRTGDAVATRSVEASANFHLNETQPDHATAQPWGLPAFIQHAPMLADQMLHTMTTHTPGGADGISLMLLADTLYGLKKLTTEDPT